MKVSCSAPMALPQLPSGTFIVKAAYTLPFTIDRVYAAFLSPVVVNHIQQGITDARCDI